MDVVNDFDKVKADRRKARFPLGTLVCYESIVLHSEIKTCMIVGCWQFSDSMKYREELFNVCPREQLGTSGYLLLPNDGSPFLYAWFSDVDNKRMHAL